MAHQLFQLPRATAISSDLTLVSGAKVSFFLTGTTTPTDTYQDSGLTTPHTNPVVADSAGRLPAIYLDPEVEYRVTFTDADDVEIYPAIDPVNDQPITQAAVVDVLSQSIIGGLLYPRTDAEIAASVTPTNYYRVPGDIRRYGAVDGQDSTTAIAAAVAQMNAGGADVYIPTGTFTSTTSHQVTYTGWRIIGDDCIRSIIRFTGSGVGIVIGGTAGGGLFGYMRGVGLYNGGTRTSGIVLYNAGGSSFYNVFVGGLGVGFSSHGVLVNEDYDSPKGNNNNMRFINVGSQRNTGAGFAIPATGSDQNAIEFIACNGSYNTSHGMLLKGQANRVIGGIYEGNGGYGIQISEAADSSDSTRSVIHYPYLESNTSGGVRGGGNSLGNVIYLDGLNSNSSYTRAAGSEDFWIQPNNSSGPFMQMGDPECYLKVHSVTSGGTRLGLSAAGSTTNLTLYIGGQGTGGTHFEADNDTTTATVRIGQQGSGLRTVLRGQTNFGANTVANVSFGVTLPSTAYTIQLGANANKTFWWSSKTTTGFTLNASSSSSDTVDWTVVL